MIRPALSAVILAVLVAGPTPAVAQEPPSGSDTKLGQRLFRAIGCWECHGSAAQGGGTAGPRLAATALPYGAFLRQLRVPRNAMPPYEPKIVTDSEVADIFAYVRSIAEPKPAKDIPLLDALK